MNVVTLRNGRQLEDPVGKSKSTGEKESNKPQSKEVEVGSDKPKIPFPQRLAKLKLDAQFKKFIDMLKKNLH